MFTTNLMASFCRDQTSALSKTKYFYPILGAISVVLRREKYYLDDFTESIEIVV